MQPIKELSSVAGWCAGRGCALIRQLANACAKFKVPQIVVVHIFIVVITVHGCFTDKPLH